MSPTIFDPPMSLSERTVDVWYLLLDSLTDPVLPCRCEQILSADERERWQRFSFEAGRRQYLLSHGFVRLVLSHYAPIPPQSWRFTRNSYGKPELQDLLTLRFNLTHTAGLAACVVARDREVGVDAEDIERRGRDVSEALIRHCLSAHERACFETVPATERKAAFFEYWTLKEAYLKARGFGLSLPPEGMSFSWPGGAPGPGPVRVNFSECIADDPATWHFERFMPTERHKIAIAIRRSFGSDPQMIVREFPRDADPRILSEV